MKLEKITETNGHPKKARYVMSVNKDECKLMISLLIKAKLYIPKCEYSDMIYDRICGMISCFKFGLRADEKFGDKFQPEEKERFAVHPDTSPPFN